MAISENERELVDEVACHTRRIETKLSDFLNREDIDLLRNFAFNYSEKKCQWFEFVRGSFNYLSLHTYVRFEIMDEVREFVEAFSGGDLEDASNIARNFTTHNDLDYVLDNQANSSRMFR